MTEPRLTVSDLIVNARTHLDTLADHVPAALENSDSTRIAAMVETLQTDLDLIERSLSDIQCTIRSELENI